MVLGILPRTFSAAQQTQITNWEYGQRWLGLPAGTIFPASVSYAPPAALSDDPALTLTAARVGIAPQASCAAAVDPSAAAVLDRDGCSAVMRATYVDATDSYAVTVGAAVLPGTAQADAAATAISGGFSAVLGPTVRAMSVPGTPAGEFTDQRRELSGTIAQGTYVVLYTVGFTDSRPRQKISQDAYTAGEMTSLGAGVARKVLSTLGAPVPPPKCPGVPGC
jgi:hypothetical protein